MLALHALISFTLTAAVPHEQVMLARLLDDGKTALLALKNYTSTADLEKQLTQTAHVLSAHVVTLPAQNATLAMVRTDRAMDGFDARLGKAGLSVHWQDTKAAAAFAEHIGLPIAVDLPQGAGTKAFRAAEKTLRQRLYEVARHKFDELVGGNALNHWTLLRLADIAATTQGRAAGCAGYQHVIDSAPLHLAAKVATLRSIYLACDNAVPADWVAWLQPVRRDDKSGQYLRAESQWAFWEVVKPENAADVFEAGAAVATAVQRRKLLAIACLGLSKDALEAFAQKNAKEILHHPDEKALRLVMSYTLCVDRESSSSLLDQGHWTPPAPLQKWASAWRKSLGTCSVSPAARTVAQGGVDDVADLEHLVQSAAARVKTLQVAVRADPNQHSERK